MDRYKTTFETWDKVASFYQDKFMDMDLYNDTYDIFCKQIEKSNAKVFEIGCGPGNITRYLLSKRPDFKIEAIDTSHNMIRLAKENNPTASFKVMDCRQIDTITDKFDAIMCGFCIPYLSKDHCLKLLKDCSSLLYSEGVLYLSAIEGDYSKSGYETGSSGDKMYVHYYGQEYLQRTLELNNFEVIDLIRKHDPKTSHRSSTHIIFVARKN
jgi:ubiquinone/menaquinone biosynthesis C-methylase UbiE